MKWGVHYSYLPQRAGRFIEGFWHICVSIESCLFCPTLCPAGPSDINEPASTSWTSCTDASDATITLTTNQPYRLYNFVSKPGQYSIIKFAPMCARQNASLEQKVASHYQVKFGLNLASTLLGDISLWTDGTNDETPPVSLSVQPPSYRVLLISDILGVWGHPRIVLGGELPLPARDRAVHRKDEPLYIESKLQTLSILRPISSCCSYGADSYWLKA